MIVISLNSINKCILDDMINCPWRLFFVLEQLLVISDTCVFEYLFEIKSNN